MDPTLSVAIVAAGAALDGSAVGSLAPSWHAPLNWRAGRAAKRAAVRDTAQRTIVDGDAER